MTLGELTVGNSGVISGYITDRNSFREKL